MTYINGFSVIDELDALVRSFGEDHKETLFDKIINSPNFGIIVGYNLDGLMWHFDDGEYKKAIFDNIINSPDFGIIVGENLDGLMWHFGYGEYKKAIFDNIINPSNDPFTFCDLVRENLDGLMRYFGYGGYKEVIFDEIINPFNFGNIVRENLDGLMWHFGEDYKEDLYTKITGNNRVLSDLVRYNLDGLMRHFLAEHKKEDLFNKIINFDHFDFENIVSENLNGLMWHFGAEHKEDLFNEISESTNFVNIVSQNLDGLINHFFEYRHRLQECIKQECPNQSDICDYKIHKCKEQIEQSVKSKALALKSSVDPNQSESRGVARLPDGIVAKIAVLGGPHVNVSKDDVRHFEDVAKSALTSQTNQP